MSKFGFVLRRLKMLQRQEKLAKGELRWWPAIQRYWQYVSSTVLYLGNPMKNYNHRRAISQPIISILLYAFAAIINFFLVTHRPIDDGIAYWPIFFLILQNHTRTTQSILANHYKALACGMFYSFMVYAINSFSGWLNLIFDHNRSQLISATASAEYGAIYAAGLLLALRFRVQGHSLKRWMQDLIKAVNSGAVVFLVSAVLNMILESQLIDITFDQAAKNVAEHIALWGFLAHHICAVVKRSTVEC